MDRRLIAVVVASSLLLVGCEGSSSRSEATPMGKNALVMGGKPAPDEQSSTRNGKDAAAMPKQQPARPLPEDVDLNTTDVQLGTHALIAAREDVSNDAAGGATVVQRQQFLYQLWYPLMQEKQAKLQKIQDERARSAERRVTEAKRVHQHDEAMAKTAADYDAQVEAERRKTVPILQK